MKKSGKDIAKATIDKTKQAWFRKKLLTWFNAFGRDFPWREKDTTHYQMLVSEILLQRTKAETVSAFYHPFFQRYPDWESLSHATQAELEIVLTPLGLQKHRAKRIRHIMDNWQKRAGIWPGRTDELKDSGMGSLYLANAYSLFVLHKKKPLLDVNMSRLFSRFFGTEDKKDVRHNKAMNALADEVIQSTHCRELNWAVLDFAALVCKARKPDCPHCPLQSLCHYYIDKK